MREFGEINFVGQLFQPNEELLEFWSLKGQCYKDKPTWCNVAFDIFILVPVNENYRGAHTHTWFSAYTVISSAAPFSVSKNLFSTMMFTCAISYRTGLDPFKNLVTGPRKCHDYLYQKYRRVVDWEYLEKNSATFELIKSWATEPRGWKCSCERIHYSPSFNMLYIEGTAHILRLPGCHI
jgi:hypothetical protein